MTPTYDRCLHLPLPTTIPTPSMWLSACPEQCGETEVTSLTTTSTTAQVPGTWHPVFPTTPLPFISDVKAEVKFLVLQLGAPSDEYLACLKAHPEVVVVDCQEPAEQPRRAACLCPRRAVNKLVAQPRGLCPDVSSTRLRSEGRLPACRAAADMGALMIDGLTDGHLAHERWRHYRARTCAAHRLWHPAGCTSAHIQDRVYRHALRWPHTLRPASQPLHKIKAATAHMKGSEV